MWPRSGFCPERSIRRGEVLSEQMQTALTHRAIIEQAKGVLAHQGDLSMHAVFDRLRSYARNRSGGQPRSSRAISARTCSPPPTANRAPPEQR
jgi:hypothetical protein